MALAPPTTALIAADAQVTKWLVISASVLVAALAVIEPLAPAAETLAVAGRAAVADLDAGGEIAVAARAAGRQQIERVAL